MPPKITAKKVSSKTIRPSSSNRLNSLKANSEARFLAPGSVAVFGVLLFFAFVIAQIIFINWWASSPSMLYIDVFNGDADGVCALHQLRLHNPQESRLVTGVKRDTLLLKRVISVRNSVLTVLNISCQPGTTPVVAETRQHSTLFWSTLRRRNS